MCGYAMHVRLCPGGACVVMPRMCSCAQGELACLIVQCMCRYEQLLISDLVHEHRCPVCGARSNSVAPGAAHTVYEIRAVTK